MKKLLIICGPTATGKTSLGLKLAQKFSGQIISADSRQVFKKMDIGTGKDLPKNAKPKKDGHYLIQNIKIWGYDLVNPDQDFSVAHFVNFSIPKIKSIWQKGDLPIAVGGTGLYLKSLTRPIETISIPANQNLRNKLNQLSVKKLQAKLKKLQAGYFNQMNRSDRLNPRRLIRAIEIHFHTLHGKSDPTRSDLPETNYFWLGLKTDKKILDQRIEKRVDQRLASGAQKEVQKLIQFGCFWDLPAMSAMGYRQWQPYFQKKATLKQVRKNWITAEKQYLRRQLTWFENQPNIHWFDISKPDFQKTVATQVKSWYTNN